MSHDSYKKLQSNLMMFYTGDVRDANNILGEETKNLASNEEKIEGTKKLVEMTHTLKERFENNDIDALGGILNESWAIKRNLAKGISNPSIDTYYEKAIKAGAMGGKLLGAGGGGFLLFYVPEEKNKENVRKSLSNLKEMPFELDQAGCGIIFMD
jgi:D-glycero-alpha-D-manno-heptose-7-phosphate kinase